MARVVDSYSNILTVKLFAKIADEDAFVRESVDDHQAAMTRHQAYTAKIMFVLTLLNAALLVGTATVGLWLWSHGVVSAGVVATALPLAWQTTNAAGWVSWEVSSIFENVGVVQEGMQSIAVPHSGVDRPDARQLGDTPHGLQDRRPLRRELERIAIGRGHGRSAPACFLGLGRRGEEVVGLVAGAFRDREAARAH